MRNIIQRVHCSHTLTGAKEWAENAFGEKKVKLLPKDNLKPHIWEAQMTPKE